MSIKKKLSILKPLDRVLILLLFVVAPLVTVLGWVVIYLLSELSSSLGGDDWGDWVKEWGLTLWCALKILWHFMAITFAGFNIGQILKEKKSKIGGYLLVANILIAGGGAIFIAILESNLKIFETIEAFSFLFHLFISPYLIALVFSARIWQIRSNKLSKSP